jgi:hypothetical protein
MTMMKYSAPGLAVEVGVEVEFGPEVEVGDEVESGLEVEVGVEVEIVAAQVVHSQILLEDHHIYYRLALVRDLRTTHLIMLDLNSSTACFPSPKCIPVLIPVVS